MVAIKIQYILYASLLIVTSVVFAVAFAIPIEDDISSPNLNKSHKYNILMTTADSCKPLVIGHRGASGYAPEHTLGSYALAITMGADYIEPDLVMTKDGHMVARHDNELSTTTDVSTKAEFADRHRTQTVDGIELTGWFTEDFTLEELKTLRAIERIPKNRPGNVRMNFAYEILTFQEIIDLVKGMEISHRRAIGLYPEIKHSTHFKNKGLPMEQVLVDTFKLNGYDSHRDPVFIQSFEVNNLKELKNLTSLRLLQLYESNRSLKPYDQLVEGSSLTYGEMATADGLREVAKYAEAVGPDKSFIIPRDDNNRLGNPTDFVQLAHAVGLEVHPYTFRAENSFLPEEFRIGEDLDAGIGNLSGELQAFIDAEIDGLFSDQPDIPIRVRGKCRDN